MERRVKQQVSNEQTLGALRVHIAEMQTVCALHTRAHIERFKEKQCQMQRASRVAYSGCDTFKLVLHYGNSLEIVSANRVLHPLVL